MDTEVIPDFTNIDPQPISLRKPFQGLQLQVIDCLEKWEAQKHRWLKPVNEWNNSKPIVEKESEVPMI